MKKVDKKLKESIMDHWSKLLDEHKRNMYTRTEVKFPKFIRKVYEGEEIRPSFIAYSVFPWIFDKKITAHKYFVYINLYFVELNFYFIGR